ncbi:vacuolar protein sorting-associated protein 32 homolog 2-like [Trifolium pratense]|uniref:vacuolar protein sorting-associated protein 32 homolog 2-like n=1 Tax=Trifolium pratense TaxID=57577 RepID=UPI001E6969A8|nr:vacuolar protein sorting-associated protein 32 homolog 2-like [Trifolium pratense]
MKYHTVFVFILSRKSTQSLFQFVLCRSDQISCSPLSPHSCYSAAIQCLKRKRLYEQQVEQLGNQQLRIHDQMIMLEGAKATTETVELEALRFGASTMKAMQKATNINDVDKTMDEINEQTENMKQIQEALSTPFGAADFDEDELEAELEELEGAELEEELLQPVTTAPAASVHVPAGRQPTRPVPAKSTPEEDELAALQAEMAL